MLPIKDNVPTRTFPLVTVAIIAVNVIVWIWEFTGTSVQHDVYEFGYYPCKLAPPCVIEQAVNAEVSWWDGAFTSMFMHGGWEHIIFNMLFLWIFGNNVEDSLGRVRFFLWYIAGGLAATATQTFVTLTFGNQQDASIPNIGASGAIAAVLGAYLILLPHARVLTAIFFFLIFFQELPAVVFLGIWFVFQLWQGGFALFYPQAGGGVAFFAHVGGFVFGAVTVKLVAKQRPLQPAY
jgi:rhomboid family protein